MKKRGLLSLILTICMVLLLTPTVAYAEGVIINSGDPINVRVKDYSVDKSSISVDLFVIFRNKETGEEQPREGIDTITPENVTVGTFKTMKTNAIEDAKTKLNEWLEIMRQANPDVQFMVVGDMAVEGTDVEFDNRTYAMKSDGDDSIIIGDEASGNTTGGSQTTSRYMEINGDYGYTGNYSVTMTVEVKQAAKEIELIEINNATLTFKDGDKPVFTGTTPDDAPYVLDFEGWFGEDYKFITSSDYWNSAYVERDWYDGLITSFKANTEYIYQLYLKLTDEAAAQGYVFGPNTKLKVNGKTVEYPHLSENGVALQIGTNLTMTPTAAGASDYKIIEGANGAWTQNSDGTLVFRANGDFSKFTGVKIDGTLIDAKNYTAVSGSTVITLKADYLQTLSVGKHTLTIVYNDGECNTEFEIKAIGEITNPQTGDNIIIFSIIFVIALTGILATCIISKKKVKNNK